MRSQTTFPFTFTPQTVYKREKLDADRQRIFVPVPPIVAGKSRQLAFTTEAGERFEIGERICVTAGAHKSFDNSDYSFFDAEQTTIEAPPFDDDVLKITGIDRADCESLRKRFSADFAERIAARPELLSETKFSVRKQALILERIEVELKARLSGDAGRLQILMKRAGFSTSTARRALEKCDCDFGSSPYQFVWNADLPFIKVHRLAQMAELKPLVTPESYLEALCFDVVRRLSGEGSILHSVEAVADRVWKEFGIGVKIASIGLERLAHFKRLKSVERKAVSDPIMSQLFGAPPPKKLYAVASVFEAEIELEDQIRQLCEGGNQASPADHAFMDEVISEAADFLQKPEMTIDAEQRAALHAIINHKIAIVTGPPGAGKTAVMALLSAYALEHKDQTREKKSRVQGVALSGRAARVLARQSRTDWIKSYFEITATTIHAGFGLFDSDGEDITATKTPDVWTLIIDEASMLSSPLAKLVLAKAKADHFVFVGDENQLPAIGAGKPFADMIARAHEFGVPVIRLKNNYRAKSASIRALCNDINCAAVETDPDIYFEGVTFVPTHYADKVLTSANFFLKAWEKTDNIDEVAIIVPSNVGEHGVAEINRVVRDLLGHPPNNLVKRDVLICTRNQYRVTNINDGRPCDIFNGERCTIVEVENDNIIVEFDGRRAVALIRPVVTHIKSTKRVKSIGGRAILPDGFAFGYAMTTHKAQGSGFSHVILPTMKPVRQNPASVNRANLYTAASRAADELIIVGSWSDVIDAAEMEAPRRITHLEGGEKQ